jgi:hypothetical protein
MVAVATGAFCQGVSTVFGASSLLLCFFTFLREVLVVVGAGTTFLDSPFNVFSTEFLCLMFVGPFKFLNSNLALNGKRMVYFGGRGFDATPTSAYRAPTTNTKPPPDIATPLFPE